MDPKGNVKSLFLRREKDRMIYMYRRQLLIPRGDGITEGRAEMGNWSMSLQQVERAWTMGRAELQRTRCYLYDVGGNAKRKWNLSTLEKGSG